MQISFRPEQSETAVGLPLIAEIPDLTPCLIEGSNGIGKTLAVNLLSLVCGQQPWLDEERLWRSLRDGLQPTVIEVDGLRCGERLEARLDPSRWPDHPSAEVGTSLGEFRLGSTPITPAEVAKVLTVERFGGNENLQRVTRREVARAGAHVRLTSTAVDDRIDQLLSGLGELDDLLSPADPEVRNVLAKELEELNGRLTEEAERAAAARHLRDRIGLGLELRAQLDRLTTLPDELRSELAGNERRLVGLQSERDETERRIEELLAGLKPRGDLEDALEGAQRRANQRRRRQDKLAAQVNDLARAVGRETPPVKSDAKAWVEKERREADAIRARLRAADAGGRTKDAIGELLPALYAARHDGIGDETIARLQKEPLTVSELEEALIQRDAELRATPIANDATDLLAQLRERESRLHTLEDLVTRVEELDRATQLVDESKTEVENARKALTQASQTLGEYDTLVARRDDILTQINTAIGATVRLRAEVGLPASESPEDVERELAALISELDAAPAELEHRFGELEREVVAAEESHRELLKDRDAAQRRLNNLDAELRHAYRRLEVDPALADTARLIHRLNGSTEPGAIPIEALGRMSSAVSAAERRARTTRDVLQTLGRLSELMASGEVLGREGWLLGLDDLLSTGLGEQLRQRLDQPAIRDALFDGNPLQQLDLRERTVRWSDSTGIQQRPLEAFSTGEQAFAFTQARVLGLEELGDDRDRLLVLDEFGAFVAADRLAQLGSFLAEDQVKRRASQVLVVLPLQADYQAEREETTGSLRERYDQRLAQLTDRGYIAERFAPTGS